MSKSSYETCESKRKQATSTQVPLGSFLLGDDKIALPSSSAPKWKWEPTGDLAVTTMTDSALAAKNAIEKVWPDKPVYSGFCAVHASVIWFSKSDHNSLLNATDEEREKMKDKMLADFRIVVEIPGADPTPLETGKKKVGRPTKARGGQALKKD